MRLRTCPRFIVQPADRWLVVVPCCSLHGFVDASSNRTSARCVCFGNAHQRNLPPDFSKLNTGDSTVRTTSTQLGKCVSERCSSRLRASCRLGAGHPHQEGLPRSALLVRAVAGPFCRRCRHCRRCRRGFRLNENVCRLANHAPRKTRWRRGMTCSASQASGSPPASWSR